jgi:NADH-quinone oxidoreductase subunit H
VAAVFAYTEVAERRKQAERAAVSSPGIPEAHEPGGFPIPPMDLVVPPSPRLRASAGVGVGGDVGAPKTPAPEHIDGEG